ncbi:hypothetical protein Aperf_G00000118263 [Anoplocephala perfoliata]
MFWESTDNIPRITEDTTLEEFLDDDYALQHVAARNTDVIKFLTNGDRMSNLIDLVIDQSNITYDTVRFKRPSVAAEILSSRVPSILDCLVSESRQPGEDNGFDTALSITGPPGSLPFIDSLIAFIDTPSTLNPLSSGFFVKIMINLFCNKSAELLPYLRTRRPEFLSNVMRHIDLPAIAELLIEITHQDNNQQHVIAQWFLDCDVFSKLLAMLASSTETPEKQESAGKCLVELIGNYRNHVVFASSDDMDEDEVVTTSPKTQDTERPEATLLSRSIAILDVMESESFMARLVDIIGNESSSIIARNSSIDILLALVDKAKSPNGLPPSVGDEYISDIPLDSLPNARMTFTNPLLTKNNCPLLKARIKRVEAAASSVLIPRLHKLYSLLQSNNLGVSSQQNYPVMPTTAGVLDPPLGKTRLAIVNLISVLPQLRSDERNVEDLRRAFCKERFLACLMELFEKYAFNSLLHKAVVLLIKHLLNPSPDSLNEEDKSEDKNDERAQNGNADTKKEEVKLPDYLVSHILQDCHVIEWILRLSCIPHNRSNDLDPTAVCRLSKMKPKPGYSGHLWQIANLINSHFPTGESLRGLPAGVVTEWRTFVEGDLALLNEAQKITKADRNFEKPPSISLDAIHIGGNGGQMAQLLRLLQGSSDFQILASRLGAISVGRTSGGATTSHPDPNEDAFDAVDDDQDNNPVLATVIDSGEDGKEAKTLCRDRDDNENANDDDSSSSSSDEEDLQSPVVIHQQRTNQTPAFLKSSNDGQAARVKPVDTSVSPWSTEVSAVTIGNTVTVTPTIQSSTSKGDKGSKDDEWADFSTATFDGPNN